MAGGANPAGRRGAAYNGGYEWMDTGDPAYRRLIPSSSSSMLFFSSTRTSTRTTTISIVGRPSVAGGANPAGRRGPAYNGDGDAAGHRGPAYKSFLTVWVVRRIYVSRNF